MATSMNGTTSSDDAKEETSDSISIISSTSTSSMNEQNPLIDTLMDSLDSLFFDDLDKEKRHLDEVMRSQSVLLECLEQENHKFSQNESFKYLVANMQKTRQYLDKLLSLQREMENLSEKTIKLKKRALKLQQQKQKESMKREQVRERELEREKELIAKTAEQNHS